ncbi:aspartate aminotransferase family protein [Peribacillus frigoritolerans]|uniref:pyridoxal phosphate-dependent decarboxylase family protein n=1 Tax=Peribacillus frigoritolerans TaxID=450367 RepID=UPI002E2292DE|nr:aspartate aminotransferase family protein [Peribacillus frigoritolerans]
MNIDFLPDDSFIEPNGQNIDEVKSLISKVMDLIIENSTNSEQRPFLAQIENYNFDEFSIEGTPTEDILLQLQEILRNSMNPLTPNYIGHMDSMPTLISCLGEFVTTAINNNMLSLEMSPVFSQMEVQVLQKIANMFGFDEKGGGVMTSGGSLANLQALAVARNHKLQVKEAGLTGLIGQPVILVSEASHTSLHKAAMLLGLGTSSVIAVKSNHNSQMDISDLEEKIIKLLEDGKKPFAVVATAGTTVTGSIDPILSIAETARKYGLWLHVDAAYGGALVFSEKYRQLLSGIERADSITFNPQKWMYVAKTCAMVLFKNRELLEMDFRISAPYMNDTNFTNLGEVSVQGTRHADILKLYLSLQHIGLKGYDQLLKESYLLVEEFVVQVKKRSYIELASEPDTNLCCFRGRPKYVDSKKWDQWNLELQQYLLNEERVFFSLPTYKGDRWLRAVLLNPYTPISTIQKIFSKIDEFYINHHSYKSKSD